MYHDRQDLAALISSRICHDLISPLGAISNGLELLELSGVAPSPELNLITQSIENANSKIRFFRVAYGMAPNGTTLAQGEILSILKDYFNGSRVQVNWQVTRETLRRDVKIIFLLIQCLESAMPYGGTIQIDQTEGRWMVRGQSDRLHHVKTHWAILDGGNSGESLAAAQVQFAVLAELTQFRTPRPVISHEDTEILVTL